MQGRTMLLVLSAVTFSASGQVLMKSGAQRLAGVDRFEFLFSVMRDISVLSGLIAWSASTLCWLYVLRVTPLSRAYGFTSLTYVCVFLAGVFLFGEPVRRMHAIGTMLIVIGIACLFAGD